MCTWLIYMESVTSINYKLVGPITYHNIQLRSYYNIVVLILVNHFRLFKALHVYIKYMEI